jgi:Holliday junction resolvasome RuvABC DNA-binding subunit
MSKPKTLEHKRLYQLDDRLVSALNELRFGHRFKTESEAARFAMEAGLITLGYMRADVSRATKAYNKEQAAKTKAQELTYERDTDADNTAGKR